MAELFQTISSINHKYDVQWGKQLFLTIDIDWAHDAVINDTIDVIENADVAATWFITHQTPVLERLRANPKFELGIHPNFNFLLHGNLQKGRNAEEIIENILNIVPEATAVRSHSMTQNTNILDLFVKYNLTHDCNHFIPYQSGIHLKPWELWTGLTKVPYLWEDDIACLYGQIEHIHMLKEYNGLRVFDFHPIHIFLNTESMDRYEVSRAAHQDPNQLLSHRNNEVFGAREALQTILGWT